MVGEYGFWVDRDDPLESRAEDEVGGGSCKCLSVAGGEVDEEDGFVGAVAHADNAEDEKDEAEEEINEEVEAVVE
jgi:hypothetical protein